MSNQDIRRTAAEAGVKLWQIAEALGIADCSLSRKLRRELPAEEDYKVDGPNGPTGPAQKSAEKRRKAQSEGG